MSEQTPRADDSAPGDPSSISLGSASLSGGGKAVPDADVFQANSPGDNDSLEDNSMAGLPGETASVQGMTDKSVISASDTGGADADKDSGGVPTGGLATGGTIGGLTGGGMGD